jgi:hypothetical protein
LIATTLSLFAGMVDTAMVYYAAACTIYCTISYANE